MADIPCLKQVATGSSEATLNFIKKPNQSVLSLENESQNLKTEELRTLEEALVIHSPCSLDCLQSFAGDWQHAARAPQVHVLIESREAVSALKLDYFIHLRTHISAETNLIGTVRNYVNLDIDTLWLPAFKNQVWDAIMPRDIVWVCGKCHMHPRHPSYHSLMQGGLYRGCEEGCQSGDDSDGYPRELRRLAGRFPYWVGPGDNHDNNMARAEDAMFCNARELLLVVGDFQSFERQRDVQFVTPSREPRCIQHALSWANLQTGAYMHTWPQLEQGVEETMLPFKTERTPREKKLVQFWLSEGQVLPEEERNIHDWGLQRLQRI